MTRSFRDIPDHLEAIRLCKAHVPALRASCIRLPHCVEKPKPQDYQLLESQPGRAWVSNPIPDPMRKAEFEPQSAPKFATILAADATVATLPPGDGDIFDRMTV